MLAIVCSWFLFASIYLALVGSLSLHEGVAALACGGLAALWVRQIRRCGDRSLHVRPAALKPLRGTLAQLPGQTLRVGARLSIAALRGTVAGEARTRPPHQVAGCPAAADDPASAGACALSVLAASLSPDAYVLRLEPERGRVLMHAFLPEQGGGA